MRRPKNLLPSSIALLALAVAGTGTAVAATTTTTISDPTNSSYVAHVTSSGHLEVSADAALPPKPFFATAFVSNYNVDFTYGRVLGPTTASLALTEIGFLNPSSNSLAWSDYLVEVPATSASACPTSVSTYQRVGQQEALPGTSVYENFNPPVTVAPLSRGQYYCVFSVAGPDTGSASDSHSATVSLRGYVSSGAVPVSPASVPGGASIANPAR